MKSKFSRHRRLVHRLRTRRAFSPTGAPGSPGETEVRERETRANSPQPMSLSPLIGFSNPEILGLSLVAFVDSEDVVAGFATGGLRQLIGGIAVSRGDLFGGGQDG